MHMCINTKKEKRLNITMVITKPKMKPSGLFKFRLPLNTRIEMKFIVNYIVLNFADECACMTIQSITF